MKEQTLVHKSLPQNPNIWVSVPDYKEPILPVSKGFGWYGLQAYDFQGDKLMCHECGGFYDWLGQHLRTHKITSKEYRIKYGLLTRAKLSSNSIHTKRREIAIKNNRAQNLIPVLKGQKPPSSGNRGHKGTLEFQNKFDTCPAQLLRWLSDASKIYGDNITAQEANRFRSGFTSVLIHRFGTFNKAKQLIKLSTNNVGHQPEFIKQILLEDICCFYRKNKRWPKVKDYNNHKMVCNESPLLKYGGLVQLRQEAMKLKDEQDKRASIDINAITNKIEMEYAGRARV